MAQVYLDPGDKYKIINDDVQVFGHDGVEQVIIESGADNVELAQNIERVDFAGDVSDFTFKAEGTQLQVFDKEGNKITEIGVQGDEDGTELAFTDGVVKAIFDRNAHAIKVGGADVPKDNPGAVEPVDIDTSDHSEASEVTTTAPQITISDVKVTEGNDGTQQATVVVTLSQTPAQGESVTVDWATQDGTATTADNDYAEASGTLTFAPGEVQKTITVDVNGDLNVEDDETFKVVLSNVTGQVQGQDVKIADDTGVVTIQNDDKAVDHYVLSADTTQVEEGNAITFTLKAVDADGNEVPVAEDTTFSYNVAGSDLDGAASKGSANDVSPASGKVSIEAGKSSVSFTVTPIDDNTAEGMEGFKVTVLDSSLSPVATEKFAVTDPTGEGAGSTFTLTKDLDSITGTSGDDVIKAVIYPGGGDNNTWNTADSIDGKAGTDTIKAQVINEATKTVAGLSASNVEKVEFKHIDGNTSADTTFTVDVGNISGLQEVWVSNSSSYNTGNDTTTDDTLKISNISSGVKLGVANNDANLKVVADYATAATSGSSDEANIVLGGGTTGEVDLGAGFEKVKIDVTDASTVNAMDLSSGGTATLKEVDITGDKDVTIKSLTGFKTTADYTVDASQVTGNVTLELNASSHLTAKGGSGSDDVLTLDLAGNTVTSGMSVSGFETLKLIDTGGNNTLKYSLIDGVDNLQIKGTTTTGISANVITLKDVSAGTDVNFVGTGKDKAQYFNGLTYQLANSTGKSDSVNLSVNNAGTATSSTKAATIGNITTNGIENVTLDFADFSKVSIANFTDGALENLTIKGASDITFASGILTASVESVDASEASGDIDWGNLFKGVTFSKDLTFQGSSGADTISHSPKGTGTKTMDFNLGDGNDKLVIDDNIAGKLKVDGGAGTDVFDFDKTAAVTVAHFDNFEEIDIEKNKLAGGSLTLKVDDGYAEKVKIVEVSGGTADLTFESTGDIDLSHLSFTGWTSGTDKLTIKGGTGADSLTGSSVADIIQGGKGADTITTGGGADKVVLDSPFAAADTIKDFNAGGAAGATPADKIYIDVVANSKNSFGATNQLPSKVFAGTKTLNILSATTKWKVVTQKAGANFTGSNTSNAATIKKLFLGTTVKVSNDFGGGSKDKLIVGTKAISKVLGSKTNALLFFYDTDDKALQLVKVHWGNAGASAAASATVTKGFSITIKTIAHVTHTGTLDPTDILVF